MREQHFVVKAAESLVKMTLFEDTMPFEKVDEPLLKSALAASSAPIMSGAGMAGGQKSGHKYIKRTGSPGNYTYWYKTPDGKLVSGDEPGKSKKPSESMENIKQKYNLTDEDIAIRRQHGIPLSVGGVKLHSGHPKLVAEWTDSKGRNQKLYKPEYLEQASKAKFNRMFELKNNMPDIRNKIESDMNAEGMGKDKVTATVVKLIDSAYFRVGNEKYAEENETYGVSTLLKDHMTVGEDGVSFDYVGKKSMDQHKFVADPQATENLIKLRETPGDRLFQYQDKSGEYKPITSRDVNNYLEKWGVTAKDFRTYHASRLCATYLSDMGIPADEKAMRRNMVRAVQQTADKLGHTPSVCRKNYISSEILKAYERGEIMEDYIEKSNKNRDQKGQFSKNEQSFNNLLDRIHEQINQGNKKTQGKKPNEAKKK